MGRPESVFLLPGQWLFSVEDRRVSTILGSCVSVVVHDVHRHFGGLCHYLLPSASPGAGAGAKYGNVAIPALLTRFFEAGSSPSDLAVAVVGGGLLMDADSFFFVGDRNVALAKELRSWRPIPSSRSPGTAAAPSAAGSRSEPVQVTWMCGSSAGH